MFPILSVTVYFLKVLSQESHGTVHYIKGRQTCVVEGVTWLHCTPSRTSCLTMGKAGKAHPGRSRDSLYHQACAHALSLAWSFHVEPSVPLPPWPSSFQPVPPLAFPQGNFPWAQPGLVPFLCARLSFLLLISCVM